MSTQETRMFAIKPDGTLGGAIIVVDHHTQKLEALSPVSRVPLAYAVGQNHPPKDWQVVDAFDLTKWEWAGCKKDALAKLRRVAGRHRAA